MDIIQNFYNNMAAQYDKLFFDWQASTREQAAILDGIFADNGFDRSAEILDCACGIGTQAIGLAALGYRVTASDISDGELAEAARRAAENGVNIRFEHADFCALSDTFSGQFDIIIAMDNALPHMLTGEALEAAVRSIVGQIKPGGIFAASIRDYDSLLDEKPPYSPPYIHKTDKGQRVSFQTWAWSDDNYRLTQYIIEDEDSLKISKFECEYRAVRRTELTELLLAAGCSEVAWKFPQETGFYQPVVAARKPAGTESPAEERYEFRYIRPEEAEEACDIEEECFPGAEYCSREEITERVVKTPGSFYVAKDRETGRLAGFLTYVATDEATVKNEFFTHPELFEPEGENAVILGLDIRPAFQRRGIGTALMRKFCEEKRREGRKKIILTCHDDKIPMYERMGFRNQGISGSDWGGEIWNEMVMIL